MDIIVLTDLADLVVLQMIATSGLSTSGKLLLLQALKGNTGYAFVAASASQNVIVSFILEPEIQSETII